MVVGRVAVGFALAVVLAAPACTTYRVAPSDGGDVADTNAGGQAGGGGASQGAAGDSGAHDASDAAMDTAADLPTDAPIDARDGSDTQTDRPANVAKGGTCQVTNDCQTGLACSPDGICCDRACTNSCEACDVQGSVGTCTPLRNGLPRGNRQACAGGTSSCAGSCAGLTDGSCSYPTGNCGAGPTCSGNDTVGQSTCAAGACTTPGPAACAGGFVCSGSACKTSCVSDGDCRTTHLCQGGLCVRRALKIGMGGRGTGCALLSDSSVYCWGYNASGELGVDAVTAATPMSIPKPTVPVVGLPTGDPPTDVAVGGGSTCAQLTSGAVYCWGSNFSGQLGDGTFTSSSRAVKVNGLPSATSISVGSGHACALIGSDSSVYCWGYDNVGQVGSGTFNAAGIPTPTKVGLNLTIRSIAAGTDFTCALAGVGDVQCWGANTFGQIGPTLVPASDPGIATPVSAGFNRNAAAIAGNAAAQFTCAITNVGGVQCWGLNTYGQLGNGTIDTGTVPSANPTPVNVAGLGAVPTSLSIGYAHACGLTSGGVLYCWGNNGYGQLGVGSSTANSPPSAVRASAITAAGLSISAVALGANHTCVLATNGTVWCFGSNSYGQLGNNTFIDSATPVQVVGW